MNLNQLAILLNQFGGVHNLADELNTNANAIQKAIDGESLSRLESANLDEAFARFEKKAIKGKIDYDLDELDEYTTQLENVLEALDDLDNIETFRKVFADKKKRAKYRRYYTDENGKQRYKYLNKKKPVISLNDLEKLDLLFNDGYATLAIQSKLIEWLNEENHSAATFLNKFKKDGFSLRYDRLKDSAFWQWFRETFYE